LIQAGHVLGHWREPFWRWHRNGGISDLNDGFGSRKRAGEHMKNQQEQERFSHKDLVSSFCA
jgi:hypothetical protein